MRLLGFIVPMVMAVAVYAGAREAGVMSAADCIFSETVDSIDDFSAVIDFDTTVVDLGLLDEAGEVRTCVFPFVNAGNAPLVLTYVHASCGCMRLSYPRHPIAPGDSAKISVEVSPASLPLGDFKRGVMVRSNAANGKEVLKVVGRIVKQE